MYYCLRFYGMYIALPCFRRFFWWHLLFLSIDSRLTGTEIYSSAHLFLTKSVYFSSCCLLKAWNHHVRMFESKCKHSNWKKTIGFVDFLWNSDYSATYWWTRLWSWRYTPSQSEPNILVYQVDLIFFLGLKL